MNDGVANPAGFNLHTGLGSPVADRLVRDLVSSNSSAVTDNFVPGVPVRSVEFGISKSDENTTRFHRDIAFDALSTSADGGSHRPLSSRPVSEFTVVSRKSTVDSIMSGSSLDTEDRTDLDDDLFLATASDGVTDESPPDTSTTDTSAVE